MDTAFGLKSKINLFIAEGSLRNLCNFFLNTLLLWEEANFHAMEEGQN